MGPGGRMWWMMALIACGDGAQTVDTSGGDGPVGEDVDPGGYRSATSIGSTTFECEWTEADCPVDCDGNTAPVLGDPIFVVNGVEADTFGVGDVVQIEIPYTDGEGNVGCGTETYGFSSPDMAENSTGSTCSNLPADSESSGVYLGFDVGTVDPGTLSVMVRLTDGCGADSERYEQTWTF